MKGFINCFKNNLKSFSGNECVVELCGFRELLVTGCVCIDDFNDGIIAITTVDGPVKIIGSRLSITAFRADIMYVEGCISRIETEMIG